MLVAAWSGQKFFLVILKTGLVARLILSKNRAERTEGVSRLTVCVFILKTLKAVMDKQHVKSHQYHIKID